MLSVYLRPPDEELAGAPPAGVNTPGAGRGAPPPGPVLGITGPSPLPPNSISFVARRLTMIVPGPRPKLRLRIVWSADGFGSSKPYCVAIKPGLLKSIGIPGRALNKVVP